MILVDSCKVNCQTLLITYLKLTIRIAKHVWREKNIKSECDFIGFKNNRLNYRCEECKNTSTKPINQLIEKFPNTYQFCNGDLNKFVLLLRKGFILMSILIAGEDLMKHRYHLKKIFTVN